MERSRIRVLGSLGCFCLAAAAAAAALSVAAFRVFTKAAVIVLADGAPAYELQSPSVACARFIVRGDNNTSSSIVARMLFTLWSSSCSTARAVAGRDGCDVRAVDGRDGRKDNRAVDGREPASVDFAVEGREAPPMPGMPLAASAPDVSSTKLVW